MKMSKLFTCFTLLCLSYSSWAVVVSDTVYINRGEMMAVDSTMMPYFAFNTSNIFEVENHRILLNVGDDLILTIINTDTVAHGFDIKDYVNVDTLISAQDSAVIYQTFTVPSAYIYYDYSNAGSFRYMGLAGMIVVEDPTAQTSSFYWNLKEHQKSFNVDLSQGLTVDWTNYYPDYFTVNGRSNPHINADTNARVVGNVGDTIKIYMVNTGQSIHSMHFHGYHGEIKYSSKFPMHAGRIKDTFPAHSMEVMIIELVPDQIGEYPVHDHNLVAVSGGNIYPNGMFVTILID
jgi:FtsP/CotA-like multicopper oxidase with cupredoxin domain